MRRAAASAGQCARAGPSAGGLDGPLIRGPGRACNPAILWGTCANAGLKAGRAPNWEIGFERIRWIPLGERHRNCVAQGVASAHLSISGVLYGSHGDQLCWSHAPTRPDKGQGGRGREGATRTVRVELGLIMTSRWASGVRMPFARNFCQTREEDEAADIDDAVDGILDQKRISRLTALSPKPISRQTGGIEGRAGSRGRHPR